MRRTSRMQKKVWHILPADGAAGPLGRELNVPVLLGQALINRGIKNADEAKSFLNPKLNELIEPERMPGIAAAVERIEKAVKDKDKIVIYGDYDVAGITAVTILLGVFKLLGVNVV